MYDAVTRFLGDGVLMYASDYPHSECQFPETVSNFLAWDINPELTLWYGSAAMMEVTGIHKRIEKPKTKS